LTHSLGSDPQTAPAESLCLCCQTLKPPIVTLATALVHNLRCSSCGFIWIVRIAEPTPSDLAEVPQTLY